MCSTALSITMLFVNVLSSNPRGGTIFQAFVQQVVPLLKMDNT